MISIKLQKLTIKINRIDKVGHLRVALFYC